MVLYGCSWPVTAIASIWPNGRTQFCADVRSPLFAHRVVAELGHFVRFFVSRLAELMLLLAASQQFHECFEERELSR
jgi:hypothetical protein